MKKLVVAFVALSMLLCSGAAFAGAKKAKAKAEKPKTVQCGFGDKTVMTATNMECTNMGGLVLNFPGPEPEKAAPKAKKAKK